MQSMPGQVPIMKLCEHAHLRNLSRACSAEYGSVIRCLESRELDITAGAIDAPDPKQI
jgi:hypothetical protein